MAKWDRKYHEEFAVDAVKTAKRELPYTYECSSQAVYATIRANKDIARARAHLSSIGQREGKRTRKLWGAVGKVERQVEQAANRIAKCLLPR